MPQGTGAATGGVGPGLRRWWEDALSGMVLDHRQRHITNVVDALRAATGLPRNVDGRQQQRGQHGQYRKDDQQLDKM